MNSFGPSSLCREGTYKCKDTWRIKITCHIKTSLPLLLSLKLTAGLISSWVHITELESLLKSQITASLSIVVEISSQVNHFWKV